MRGTRGVEIVTRKSDHILVVRDVPELRGSWHQRQSSVQSQSGSQGISSSTGVTQTHTIEPVAHVASKPSLAALFKRPAPIKEEPTTPGGTLAGETSPKLPKSGASAGLLAGMKRDKSPVGGGEPIGGQTTSSKELAQLITIMNGLRSDFKGDIGELTKRLDSVDAKFKQINSSLTNIHQTATTTTSPNTKTNLTTLTTRDTIIDAPLPTPLTAATTTTTTETTTKTLAAPGEHHHHHHRHGHQYGTSATINSQLRTRPDTNLPHDNIRVTPSATSKLDKGDPSTTATTTASIQASHTTTSTVRARSPHKHHHHHHHHKKTPAPTTTTSSSASQQPLDQPTASGGSQQQQTTSSDGTQTTKSINKAPSTTSLHHRLMKSRVLEEKSDHDVSDDEQDETSKL